MRIGAQHRSTSNIIGAFYGADVNKSGQVTDRDVNRIREIMDFYDIKLQWEEWNLAYEEDSPYRVDTDLTDRVVHVDNRHFRIKHEKWGGQSLYQLYKKAYTPWKWFKKLKKTAEEEGLVFFSTAFDRTAVDFLEELNSASPLK